MAGKAIPILDIGEDGKIEEVKEIKKVPVPRARKAKPKNLNDAVKMQVEVMDDVEKIEAEAKAKMEEANRKRDEARAELDKYLAPVRAKVKVISEEIVLAEKNFKKYSEKAKGYKAAITESKAKLEALYGELEATGIPRVLVGAKKVDKVKVNGNAGRTTIKPDMLGAFKPILIQAQKRHGDRNRETAIVIMSDGHVFSAKRVDLEKDINIMEPVGFTVNSHRMSDVTTQPGWLETKDVAYGIVYALGRTDEFPALSPTSDPATIFVNGEAIKEADYHFEVLEEVL